MTYCDLIIAMISKVQGWKRKECCYTAEGAKAIFILEKDGVEYEVSIRPMRKRKPERKNVLGGVVVEEVENMRIDVRETAKRDKLEPMKPFLSSKWCECEKPEFLCYPEDGECPCGIHKHHVHCSKCGSVSQIG